MNVKRKRRGSGDDERSSVASNPPSNAVDTEGVNELVRTQRVQEDVACRHSFTVSQDGEEWSMLVPGVLEFDDR